MRTPQDLDWSPDINTMLEDLASDIQMAVLGLLKSQQKVPYSEVGYKMITEVCEKVIEKHQNDSVQHVDFSIQPLAELTRDMRIARTTPKITIKHVRGECNKN
jgi:hypothetical protein